VELIYLAIPLASLIGAIIAGFMGKQIGRSGAHIVTIAGVSVSFILSLIVLNQHVFQGAPTYNASVYTWMVSDGLRFEVGFLIDHLTVMMLTVVSGVSLAVHVYTIGYMHDDDGYQRFFSYISLFTFSMLMLVMSNNFMQLFFGWEAVGLVSYLLIGFWYKKETAIFANLKAFLVNRVGDFGFILGIAAIVMYAGSLDYADVFAKAPQLANQSIHLFGSDMSLMSVICILLFIGAMGKSAQVPLHVWLPDSMEGPTPISALIHAATMVTAGIFMVARMSPLYEWSETALSFVMVIGSITALFMGLIGIVQNDIKRVVAYSTLSQLGYMTVALGVSGTGHAQNGRPEKIHADYLLDVFDRHAGLDRFSRFLRFLLQGCDYRSRASFAVAGSAGGVLDGGRRCVHHCILFFPSVLHGVPRQGAHGSSYKRTFA